MENVNNTYFTLVAGGNGLIGKAIVKELIKTRNVISLDNKIITFKHKNLINFKLDITDKKSIENFFKMISKKKILIHSFVNCSYPRTKDWGTKFENLKFESINRNFSYQIGSLIYFLKFIISHYLSNNIKGKIILFSSIQGVSAPKFHHYDGTDMSSPIEYSAIKSGIISLVKYLAKYYKNKNLNINCISPGGLKTNQPKKFIYKYKKATINKGLLDPNDVVGTTDFLLSDKSNYINGQNIIIDDGWSL